MPSAGVGVGLHGALQVRDALAVVILQPQGGIDVAGGGRGAHDAPVGAVQVLPGQLFAGVDLLHQLLALVRGAGDEQGAVGNGLLVGSLGGLAVIPVLGVVGILAQTVAGRGQDDLCAVVIQPAMDLSRDKNAEEMKWSPLEMGAAMQAHGA